MDNSADIVSGEIDHQGTITGSLRAVGNNVELSGNIGRSVLVLGRDFKLHPGAVIGRSLTANGDNLLIEGTVQGNVQLNGDRVVITGQIDGEVTIEAVEISIEPSATINGDITYISESEEKLTLAPGADVRGEIFYRTPTATEAQRNYTLRVLQIANILAAFILGIIVVRIFRPYAEESFRQLCSRFIASLASGLLGVIGLAFCLLLLALSILLLISGLVLMQGDISGMGMMFLVFSILMIPISSFTSVTGGLIYYSGTIIVAYVIVYLLITIFKKDNRRLTASSLLLGLVLLGVLFSIEWIGGIVSVTTMIIGAGAIIMGIRYCRVKQPLTKMIEAEEEPLPDENKPTAQNPEA